MHMDGDQSDSVRVKRKRKQCEAANCGRMQTSEKCLMIIDSTGSFCDCSRSLRVVGLAGRSDTHASIAICTSNSTSSKPSVSTWRGMHGILAHGYVIYTDQYLLMHVCGCLRD